MSFHLRGNLNVSQCMYYTLTRTKKWRQKKWTFYSNYYCYRGRNTPKPLLIYSILDILWTLTQTVHYSQFFFTININKCKCWREITGETLFSKEFYQITIPYNRIKKGKIKMNCVGNMYKHLISHNKTMYICYILPV